jgi:hypothetical protein
MTDFSFSDVSSDFSTVSEDEPIVTWVDQTIWDAEQSGFLSELGAHVTTDSFTDPQAFAASVEQARDEGLSSGENSENVPSAPLSRDEIREAIFAKLRRPDGTPFAAGYVSGPAARKAMYEGEDVRNGVWRSGVAGENRTTRVTRYEDRATIDDRAAQHDEGFVVDKDGYAISGNFGWVMDGQTGALLLFDPSDNQFFTADGTAYTKPDNMSVLDMIQQGYRMRAIHHTTPVAGMPVTGAGMIELDSGRITKITDESGHYRPDAVQQHQAVSSLSEQGYDLAKTEVRLTGNDMTGRPTDKAGWIDAAGATNPDFPTGDVDLRAEQFLQTGGDEYQIRMKQALNEQIIDHGGHVAGPQPTEGEIIVNDDGSRQLRVVFDNDNYTLYPEGDADNPVVPADLLIVERSYARTGTGGWQSTIRYASGRTVVNDVTADDVPYSVRFAPAQPAQPASDAVPPASGGGGDASSSSSVSEDEPAPAPRQQDTSSSESASEDGDNASEDGSDDGADDDGADGDNAREDSDGDVQADFVRKARSYLQTAGHAAFATWLGGLPQDNQDTLLADPELAAAWRRENAAPQAPTWQPTEADWAAAAEANATYVDSLNDRGTANFTVAGFSLIIGGGHDAQHAGWVSGAGDRTTGSVTVRKSGVGRGAGSLTFTGVPAAKQEVVRAAVARFSRKEVRFS